MNPNCYHLAGPTGVKSATQRIKQALQEEQPQYVLRIDIKSYYASIPHFKLLQDIKKYYHDPNVLAMLENIITNPIDTPKGYKNPGYGIALRGPLSQFFSALYLKPLDDALSCMDIVYLRYNDDIIALCKTKRQLNRCKKRMMEVLHERQLSLSRKKSRMGPICSGFHFLGIDYLPTRLEDNITVTHANDDSIAQHDVVYSLVNGGGKTTSNDQSHAPIRIVPHARTLRKARTQVQLMVATGFSTRRIRSYLHRFVLWWVNTTKLWNYNEIIKWFCDASFDIKATAFAAALLIRHNISDSSCTTVRDLHAVGFDRAETVLAA